jgi:periplasmic protein CpxP/Spy
MEKTKLISLLAVGLLLSNLLLVGFILYNKPKHGHEYPPPHGGPRDLIIERLHFNDSQVAQYDKLIAWHRGEIGKADDQITTLKNQLYSTLASSANSRLKDSLLGAISAVQQNIEKIHYRHFEDIRNLCTEQQKPDFEALTKDMASLFAPPPPFKRH